MNNRICYPKPLFIIILLKRRKKNNGNISQEFSLSFKHTTPITVIRIITAKNENEPDERGFISGCLV